ncbi:polycystic kidney disease 2-like 1 protein [Asbolus verrucosus]|uniref:Polycystic kidney disease 2-like 1 protein n=1 Tax=Asbolus verrucosus TaxID=1661398 RepID=A0A482W969_ASBVE|nr:polycystic kidney disease 2-like 1 protein [Asbolus verrucosus]
MAEEFTRHDVLFTTFKEALLYMVFVVAVTMCTIGRRNAMLFFQTQALRGQFIDKEFETLNDVGITFDAIKSASDFWFYAENVLVDSLYWEQYYSNWAPVKPVIPDDKKILFENQILGVPRIRQVKVKNDSCIIHTYFKRLFLSCYDVYREADEDHEPFGPGKGTAWVYQSDNETESIPYTGDICTYEGGGFYQDLSVEKEKSAAIITDLKDNLWITRGTRAIFIDFSLYNVNLGLFSICKLVFEFPPTGGILPSHQFQTVKLLESGKWDQITFGFECAVYVIAGFFLIEEIREIMAAANLFTSLVVFPSADPTVQKILKNPTKYGNLEYLGSVKIFYNNFAASLLFFSYVKIFKYLSFNKTMGQLNNTLKNCALDILGFSIMFFIIFFAFAELGYLLFGSQVEDFSSFGVAMFTLLRTILGDFDYQAIERANRVLAPIYFLSYIFFVFFVLLNMFLAIINDTYADVKTEIAIAPEEMQMTDFLKKGFYKILKKCGCDIKFQQEKAEFNATIQEIRNALTKCGFSDLEIEMFFARYNIDLKAETGDYDVKKIMKELEGQSLAKDKLDEDTNLVHISDFITQNERLDQIGRNVQTLATKVDDLIKKLEAFESVRKNKAPQARWLTRAMAEEFSRQDVLFATFKDALLYLVFVVAVSLCTIGRRSSSMFYITQALKGQFLDAIFEASDESELKFKTIQSATDFWFYAENILLKSFYAPRVQNPYDEQPVAEDDHRILFENKLLGVPRLRQVRVKNGSCAVHKYFKKLCRSCYGIYGPNTESQEPFGLAKKTAWVYSPANKTGSISYPGSFSTYGGGGFYQDLSLNRNGTLKIINELKENLWITRATRAVFVDFSLYNANLNLFCICKLIFEFPPTGGIIPSHMFLAVQLLPWVDSWDYVTFGGECVVYAIVIFFVVEEIREVIYFKFRYWLQFWTYIDLTIISMAAANLITSQVVLPDANKAIDKIREHPAKYGNLEKLGEVKDLHNNFAALLLFFTYIKLFKYLNFNKTMGQLNNTLKRCAWDILGFSIMFFIIFFAFAELGYLVFGTQVEDFKSFGLAMFTLLRTILGDFDYEAIERANKLLAPIYFLSYIFFVFFVLLNMFLAIINDTYADVKTEIAIAPDEMQMTEFLRNGFYNLLRKCGCKIKFEEHKAEVNTVNQQIRDALKQCRFSDLEIEMFFARYNIDPLAEVGDYDVKKIMKELEGQSLAKEKLDEDDTIVHVGDFIRQQAKLEQVEGIIEMLADKIDNLLEKLESIENARKMRATQG